MPTASAAATAGDQGSARGSMDAGAAGSGGGGRGSGNGGGHVGVTRSRSPDASSAADAVRLRTVLALKEHRILDEYGRLTPEAIASSEYSMKPNKVLENPSVIAELTKDGSKIEDWAKMKSESIMLGNGQRVQVHFYKNKLTGEVNYTHQDFKVKNTVDAFDKLAEARAGYRPGSVDEVLARHKQ